MADPIRTSQACLHGWYGILGALLAILLVAPIWAVEYPPLVDYPNHLARGYILYHYDDVPSFREYYEIDYLSTPSLSMDLFMVALQPSCDVRTVGKLFLTLTLWLWLLGWHLLGRAIHGRPTWLALGAALIAYYSMFIYGFTNFAFGLGVFLIALAAWYHGRAHWGWWRHLLVALLALACFFSHLASFIFLAGSVLAVTAWECVRARKIALTALIDIVPILVPLVFVRSGGESGVSWNWPGKLVGALSLFRGYDRTLDIGFIVAVGVFVVLLFLWSQQTRAVGSVLFVGLGCVAMFVVGPTVLFGGAPADARFLPAAAALLSVSLDFTFPRPKALALLCIFLALVVFRIGMIGYYWHAIDAELSEQISLFAEFPEEAKVYSIVKVAESPDDKKRELPSFHAICYAVVDRRIYTPTLLAFRGHNPLRYKIPVRVTSHVGDAVAGFVTSIPRYRIKSHADPDPFLSADEVDWNAICANHDYLYCLRVPDDYRRELEKRCTLVGEKGAASVWRVAKER
jgi:hypothetical protein